MLAKSDSHADTWKKAPGSKSSVSQPAAPHAYGREEGSSDRRYRKCKGPEVKQVLIFYKLAEE